MAKINLIKKELAAIRIVNRCTFLEEEWEAEWMMSALMSAFKWAEGTSDVIDPNAPYAIVKAKENQLD